MPKILRLAQERKLWILRKYAYGGIPPTDPRILAMTEEQVELEFGHMELDRKLKKGSGEEYSDPEFEEWDKDTEETDSLLSYEYEKHPSEVKGASPQANLADEDDWEDDETDDLD